jgi:hypothetical protein
VVGYPGLSVKGVRICQHCRPALRNNVRWCSQSTSYIYIEAYKQKQVKEAIDGLDALRYGQYRQEMVAVKDMPAILRVNRLDNKRKPDVCLFRCLEECLDADIS